MSSTSARQRDSFDYFNIHSTVEVIADIEEGSAKRKRNRLTEEEEAKWDCDRA